MTQALGGFHRDRVPVAGDLVAGTRVGAIKPAGRAG